MIKPGGFSNVPINRDLTVVVQKRMDHSLIHQRSFQDQSEFWKLIRTTDLQQRWHLEDVHWMSWREVLQHARCCKNGLQVAFCCCPEAHLNTTDSHVNMKAGLRLPRCAVQSADCTFLFIYSAVAMLWRRTMCFTSSQLQPAQLCCPSLQVLACIPNILFSFYLAITWLKTWDLINKCAAFTYCWK